MLMASFYLKRKLITNLLYTLLHSVLLELIYTIYITNELIITNFSILSYNGLAAQSHQRIIHVEMNLILNWVMR